MGQVTTSARSTIGAGAGLRAPAEYSTPPTGLFSEEPEMMKGFGRMPYGGLGQQESATVADLIGRSQAQATAVQVPKVAVTDQVPGKREGKSIPEQSIRGSLNHSQLGQVNTATAAPHQLFARAAQPATAASMNWHSQQPEGIMEILQMLKKK